MNRIVFVKVENGYMVYADSKGALFGDKRFVLNGRIAYNEIVEHYLFYPTWHMRGFGPMTLKIVSNKIIELNETIKED